MACGDKCHLKIITKVPRIWMYMVVAMIYGLCNAYFMYNYMSSPFLYYFVNIYLISFELCKPGVEFMVLNFETFY